MYKSLHKIKHKKFRYKFFYSLQMIRNKRSMKYAVPSIIANHPIVKASIKYSAFPQHLWANSETMSV